MTNSFVFKTERPWPNARLREGVIVGHTTATSAKIWVRTGQPGSFALLFYPTSMRGADKFRQRLRDVPFDATRLPAKVRQIEFKLADFSSDTTAVLALADLLPYTTLFRSPFRSLGVPSRASRRACGGMCVPMALQVARTLWEFVGECQ